MPKRPSTETNDYETDNGFIEDAPVSSKAKNKNKNKKVKVEVAKNVAGRGREEGEEGGVVGGGSIGSDGGEFWELTDKRRVGISEFKGKRMVNIREYYEKDGEMLPGKKGISLTVEQFNTLVTLLPHVETVLAGKGEKISRPDYRGAAAVEEEEEEDDDEKEEVGAGKKNFEQTSEED